METTIETEEKPTGAQWPVWVLATVACLLPLLGWAVLPMIPPGMKLPEVSGGVTAPASVLPVRHVAIGPAASPDTPPRITNVKVIDFDGDGTTEVMVCDVRRHQLLLYRQRSPEQWEEVVLGEDLSTPAHATVADIDQDGDTDVVVSVLGDIYPNDKYVGKIILLENTGEEFTPHVILDDVRRVADAQVGDLDGDGDLDVAVAVFGFAHGEILWLENLGDLKFLDHQILSAPGTVHVPLADYDQDGDLDIAAVVSQNEEEVWGLENQGDGTFKSRLLFMTYNFDIGMAGLVETDLDGDGDSDLLLPVGDNMEDVFSYPQPYHGCYWLRNDGDWKFTASRISNLGGSYAVAAGDLDADGDQDVALVSMVNDWARPGNASVVWLENDGEENFTPWQLADNPTHLVTVACGDLNQDGRDDVVAGGLHLYPPFVHLGRVSAWISTKEAD